MIYVFDDYELDIDAHELRQAGVVIPLTLKVYQVLAYLIQHHERLVLKEEMLERLWPNTYVDDSAVKRCIAAARRAIGDPSAAPRRIKTLRGQGYRFVAPITTYDRSGHRTAAVSPALPAPVSAAPACTPGATASPPGLVLSPTARPGPDESVPPGSVSARSCLTCQAPNDPTARFCIACGTPLTATCDACHQVMRLPATFCQACGKRLVPIPPAAEPLASPSLPPASPAVTEKKLVTVLCGVLSFTLARSGEMALDDRHAVMQAVSELVLTESQRYGGTLQYITGDGFLAVFGAPVAQEDHAQRAVLTALGLQRRWREHCATWQPAADTTITVRLALHTGPVIVGPLESTTAGRALVVGEVPTLALGLARRAPAEAILLSEATLRLVQQDVQTVRLPGLQIDDYPTPVPVVRLLQMRPPQGLPQPLPVRPLGPYVGRDTDLAILHSRFALVARGQGQVVGIVGEPGIGKSRLLHEFRQAVAPHTVTYLQGHCQSYGSAIPFFPLCDLLRTLWHLTEMDSPQAITSKVHSGLQSIGLAPEPWAPYLLYLLGVDTAVDVSIRSRPEVLRAQTFEALHRCLLHSSWGQPRMVIIENVHWIDATSAAYLTALAERLAGVPLLLLVTFRPGYQPAWLDKSYATQIALQPLEPADSRKVVRAILHHTSLPASLERQLLTKAQGNPFFLEELAQTVIEHRGHRPALAVTDTIQAVIAARMDRLPPEEKQLLQAAAVIGTELPLSLLGAITGVAADALLAQLTHLQTVEFLYETRFEPEPVYTFKHILTHEVAYGSLLQEQRQALHRGIVTTLETAHAERLPEQLDRLAHHARRGELWDKACHYFWQAGSKAMARAASKEAALCFEQALEALQHVPGGREIQEQHIDLCLSLHHALMRLGESHRCFEILRQATVLAEALDDASRLGWISSYMSTDCFVIGDAEGAITAGQRALALALMCDDATLQSDAQLHLGQAYHAVSNYRQAIDVLKRNVTALEEILFQEQINPDELVTDLHSFAWYVWCLAEIGEFSEGMRYGAATVRGAEILAQPYALVAAYGTLGFLYLRKGDLPQAIPMLERSLSLCQAANILLMLPTVAANMGAGYACCGRLSEALPLLEQAVAQAAAGRLMVHHALQIAALSEAYLLAGRLQEAQAMAERALDLARARKERGHEAYALRVLGAIAAEHLPAQAEPATAFYQQALELANELGMRPLLAHCHLGLGTLYGQMDERAQAYHALSAARTLFQTLDMTFWVPQAEAALARVE